MSDGPKKPSMPTLKRLFAVSGNLCAFPKCSTPVVYPDSNSIVCEICHIRGEKRDSARYDATQTNDQRNDFANLILLCNVHHKVVDDDEEAYTVERLLQMKQDHETKHAGSSLSEATLERFINCMIEGSVITTYGQTGGQTAHIINNYHGKADEAIELNVSAIEDVEISRPKGSRPNDHFVFLGINSSPGVPHHQCNVFITNRSDMEILLNKCRFEYLNTNGEVVWSQECDFHIKPLLPRKTTKCCFYGNIRDENIAKQVNLVRFVAQVVGGKEWSFDLHPFSVESKEEWEKRERIEIQNDWLTGDRGWTRLN